MFRGGLCSRVDHLLRSPHRSQFGHIGDVNDPFAVEQARRRGSWYGFERLPQQLRQRVGQAARRYGPELASVCELQSAEIDPAQPVCFLQYCLEYRREVAGRGIDDLQYFGGRSLLLQCLACLGQQPRVLHCDDRLCGEVLQQRDLLVGEGPHLLAVSAEVPQQDALLTHRYRQIGAATGNLDGGAINRVNRLILRPCKLSYVGYMNDLAARQPLASWTSRWQAFARERGVFFRVSAGCDSWHTLAIIKTERAECGPAQCVCFFQYRFEHRHEVARRVVDDLQDLCS